MAKELSLSEALTLMGAPGELVSKAEPFGGDFTKAWETHDSPADLVWIAGAASLSLGLLTEVLVAIVGEVVDESRQPLVEQAMVSARAALSDTVRDSTRCNDAAEACETLAAVAPHSFREYIHDRRIAELIAAAEVSRMAEGLIIGRLRNESQRHMAALNLAATVGGAGHAFLSAPQPLRILPGKLEQSGFQQGLVAIIESGAKAMLAVSAHRQEAVLAESMRIRIRGRQG